MVRDQFWDELFPEMPYTAASEDTKIDPVIGSAAQIEVRNYDIMYDVTKI